MNAAAAAAAAAYHLPGIERQCDLETCRELGLVEMRAQRLPLIRGHKWRRCRQLCEHTANYDGPFPHCPVNDDAVLCVRIARRKCFGHLASAGEDEHATVERICERTAQNELPSLLGGTGGGQMCGAVRCPLLKRIGGVCVEQEVERLRHGN